MQNKSKCDVCKSMGVDAVALNGDHDSIEMAKLYRVYKDGAVGIKLCRFHSIQLFLFGEKHFLLHNRAFMRVLSENKADFQIVNEE